MPQEFIIRGKTDSGATEVLNFSGHKAGYAYRLVEFQLYPSTNVGGTNYEMCATISAGKTQVPPQDPNFNDEALIAVGFIENHSGEHYPHSGSYVINDLFLITQDLILAVDDDANNPVNWQCKFVAEKMTGPQEAATNYKQFSIFDG
jgi:hypothetical protein